MLLPSIQIERFRAFRDRSVLELRPLTMLYGHNQVGKSTLLRLLPFLADSVHGKVATLDMDSPALLGAKFKELGWLGPSPSASPSLRVGVPDGTAFLELHLTDDGGLVPNRVQIGSGESPEFTVSFDGSSTRTSRTFEADYRGTNAGKDWAGRLAFASMLPSGVPAHAEERLQKIMSTLNRLERLQWLAASRPGVGDPSRQSRCCKPDGSDLAELLRDRSQILSNASSWLQQRPELGESVSVSQTAAGTPQFSLHRSSGESLPLHLAGEGVRWLLPILLSTFWAEAKSDDSPTMLVIEEPESHLHPNLQIELFQRLIELVNGEIPSVLETHSVYMLRCMQLAVAEGKLDPDHVALYWVHRGDDGHAASLTRIKVEEDGTLEGWQADTFEEEQQLARKIFRARWKQPEKADPT